jgi:GMP synthase (glutamine-hydrolysing)
MKSFLIVKTGSSFESIRNRYGDFDALIINNMPLQFEDVKIVLAQNQPFFPDSSEIKGVIITGAHDNVTDKAPWMIYLKEWIITLVENKVPILGICFGHQILAEALGGIVDFNENGGEFGVVEINRNTTYEGAGIILPETFNSYASHFQSVIKLPANAISIASNAQEPNHFVLYSNCVWGLQFHPEFNGEIANFYLRKNGKKGNRGSAEMYKKANNFGKNIFDQFYNLCIT